MTMWHYDWIGQRMWFRTRWFQVGFKYRFWPPDRFYFKRSNKMWARSGWRWVSR